MMRIIRKFKHHRANNQPTAPAQTTKPQDTYTAAPPAKSPTAVPKAPMVQPLSAIKASAPRTLTGVARVQREYRDLFADKVHVEGYSDPELVGDNVMMWSLKLSLDEGLLADQLRHARSKGYPGTLQLRVDFPQDYPRNPPFIWLQSPRLEYRTGFISHGAVCMEMLTTTGGDGGWNPAYTLESVLQTVRANFQVQQSRGIIQSWVPYAEQEARAGLQRAKELHRSTGYVG